MSCLTIVVNPTHFRMLEERLRCVERAKNGTEKCPKTILAKIDSKMDGIRQKGSTKCKNTSQEQLTADKAEAESSPPSSSSEPLHWRLVLTSGFIFILMNFS